MFRLTREKGMRSENAQGGNLTRDTRHPELVVIKQRSLTTQFLSTNPLKSVDNLSRLQYYFTFPRTLPINTQLSKKKV